MLELEEPDRAHVLQPADPAGEGEVEELGQLGTDLPGLPVDGIAAEEDEIERAGGPQHGGEGARRGQGVGAREGSVAGVQTRVGAPGHRLAENVLGARWAERHHGAGAPGVPGERDAFGHRPAAVRVHLDADARTHQPAAFELERLGQRDLLGQGRDRQRVTGGPAHAVTLSLRRPVTGPARRRRGCAGPTHPPAGGSPCHHARSE